MADTAPSEDRILAALAATWPAAATDRRNGWLIRQGAGGGKRVSAASQLEPDARIPDAEAAMEALGQPALFTLRTGEDALDRQLHAAGYEVADPTLILAAPADRIPVLESPPGQCITAVPRLSVMEEIWATGGIGPGRLAVMDRVRGPRAFLLIRDGDSPAACAFVAADGPIAMLHALEVDPAHRRRGLGARATATAAAWARGVGADTLALAVTRANDGACALYGNMGFAEVGSYHYRIKDRKDPRK
ncbi:GNAT family N-acetyltransferase [Oceanibium sediminis]|uniref:GNAT family N-acetyltransferase n=1 Tax=Oceanibium sediminis TaxID=2026339 RepID=UPI000DD3E8DE|nr:GNAT family N-acetyltransferase [Oceanibium sediminis]